MTDMELIERLERATVSAWPATIQRSTPGGWLLRATPGLQRGRSNHALPPCRELSHDEISLGVEEVEGFAREHAIEPGIQVSPLAAHAPLMDELDARGWRTQRPTLVMAGPVTGHPLRELRIEDHASPAWLRAWAACEPGRDVPGHARTVFSLLRGRAAFARVGHRAVAIAVESEALVGMFCLAVKPTQRRAGLGTAIAGALLAGSAAQIAYLQVEEQNAAARRLYARLGFTETYRYCHRTAPANSSSKLV